MTEEGRMGGLHFVTLSSIKEATQHPNIKLSTIICVMDAKTLPSWMLDFNWIFTQPLEKMVTTIQIHYLNTFSILDEAITSKIKEVLQVTLSTNNLW